MSLETCDGAQAERIANALKPGAAREQGYVVMQMAHRIKRFSNDRFEIDGFFPISKATTRPSPSVVALVNRSRLRGGRW